MEIVPILIQIFQLKLIPQVIGNKSQQMNFMQLLLKMTVHYGLGAIIFTDN